MKVVLGKHQLPHGQHAPAQDSVFTSTNAFLKHPYCSNGAGSIFNRGYIELRGAERVQEVGHRNGTENSIQDPFSK